MHCVFLLPMTFAFPMMLCGYGLRGLKGTICERDF